MIEEAAGTRMYEMKKLNAQKTIAKKQGRVDEISQVNIGYTHIRLIDMCVSAPV